MKAVKEQSHSSLVDLLAILASRCPEIDIIVDGTEVLVIFLEVDEELRDQVRAKRHLYSTQEQGTSCGS